MRIRNFAILAFVGLLNPLPCVAWAEDRDAAVEPLNPMALEVAKSRCRDMANASGKRGDEAACVAFAETEFRTLDSYRTNPLMKRHIWAVCADVSGYSDWVSARSIGVFALCAYKMMDRCNVGSGDGYQLDEIDCMRAIRTMAWLPPTLR